MDDAADEPLDEAVEALLAPEGWTRRPIGSGPFTITFARPVGAQLAAVVEIIAMPRLARRAPSTAVRTGVGFAPAMDLAPVLTVPVAAVVAFQLDPDGAPAPPPVDVRDVEAAAREIAARARAAHAGAEVRFRDPADLETAMLRQPLRADVLAPGHAVVLAASGRLPEAYTVLLDAVLAAAERGDADRRRTARVLRQLGRWDRAGRPTPPAFEVTLARVPTPSPPSQRPRGTRSAGPLRDTGPTPPWRWRPETAAFLARSGTEPAAVELTDAGRAVLDPHVPTGPGDVLRLDVWFVAGPRDANPATEIRVRIGPTDVGVLDADAAARYLPEVAAAAALYDEHVYTRGSAFRAHDGNVRLEVGPRRG